MATYNDTNGSIINVLTKAQYDSITKNDNELYFVTDENNLLSPATTFSLGAVKIGSGLNIDSTGLLSVQSPLDVNISGHAASATTADKATKDSDGNTITSTYVKKAGDTMTGTLNGTSFIGNQGTGESQVGVSYSDGTTSGKLYLWGNHSGGTSGLYDSNSGYVLRRDLADNTYTFYGTANNANKLDGYAGSFYKKYWQTSAGGSYTGWIKLMQWTVSNAGYFSPRPLIFMLYRTYNSPSPESYILSITGNWGSCELNILNGTYGNRIIEQFRISKDSTSKIYCLEMYVNTSYSTYTNVCYCSVFNSGGLEATVLSNTAQTDSSVTTVTSITTIKGISASKIYGAVWNDYAEYRDQLETIEPGYCVASTLEGKIYKTIEKFQACDGIVSDTFGFAIGESDNCKTPLAVCGRVLAYYEGQQEDYKVGDTVCAGPNGKVCKMTRDEIKEYPDRVIGHVSEIPTYNTWGTGNVSTKDRIWIKVR